MYTLEINGQLSIQGSLGELRRLTELILSPWKIYAPRPGRIDSEGLIVEES